MKDSQPSDPIAKSANRAETAWRTDRTTAVTMTAAFLAGIAVMVVKFYAYRVTGSSAILSDALESIINVVAGGLALVSVILSALPPDENHPYGHGKVEYFSAGFEGALILLAAVGIFWEGAKQIINPVPLQSLEKGLWVLVFAGLANLTIGLVLLKVGRRTRSIAVEADGKHVLSDVYTTVGVLVGLGLVHYTGLYWMDGVVACVVGANVIIIGVSLVIRSFSGLMDASDPELLGNICQLLNDHRKDTWIDVHRLRAWKSGDRVHVDFHLIVPKELSLEDGHREVKELEKIFEEHFLGRSDILIHLDPCMEGECPVCGYEPCRLRRAEPSGRTIWDRSTAIGEAPEKMV